jgi:hypothetical protein
LFCDSSAKEVLEGYLSFRAFGLTIGIRSNDAVAVSHLLKRLPPDSNPTADRPERVYTLYVSHQRSQSGGVTEENPSPDMQEQFAGQLLLARTPGLTEALEIFESELQLKVAEMCVDKVFVHAGVVGWKGRAVVVPGTSSAGKTTLIAALVRAGAEYYSDEYALLDKDGRVHPYSRPLKIRMNGGESRVDCSPEMLGGSRGVEPLPLAYVVVTQYQPSACWQPRRLSAGKAVLALLENTVPIRRRPQSCLATLCRIGSSAVAIHSARGEAYETAPMLLREIEENTWNNLPGEERIQSVGTLGR